MMLDLKNIDPAIEPLRSVGNVIEQPGSGVGGGNASGAVDVKSTGRYLLYNVFGDVSAKLDGPQIYLVRQLANGSTPPHFHEVDQFQIFTAGSGKVGRHDVATTILHYADAYTTYGPIASDEDGIDYFTVRWEADCGTHYMPESRKEKLRKSGRHFSIELDEFSQKASRDPVALIEPKEDGLAAYLIHIDANEPLELPPLAGKGRLITVMGGSLLDDEGCEHQDWAWGRMATVQATGCVAGTHGAQVLCLDFPADPAVSC